MFFNCKGAPDNLLGLSDAPRNLDTMSALTPLYKVFRCIMSLRTQHYERKVTLYDKLIIQQKQTDFQIKSVFFNLFSELLCTDCSDFVSVCAFYVGS